VWLRSIFSLTSCSVNNWPCPWSIVLQKLIVPQKQTPKLDYCVYRTRQVSVPLIIWTESTPSHPISSTSTLILSSNHAQVLQVISLLPNHSTKPVHTFIFSPNMCCKPSPSHPPWFHHPLNIPWGAQIKKLVSMRFSPLICHFLPQRPKDLA